MEKLRVVSEGIKRRESRASEAHARERNNREFRRWHGEKETVMPPEKCKIRKRNVTEGRAGKERRELRGKERTKSERRMRKRVLELPPKNGQG